MQTPPGIPQFGQAPIIGQRQQQLQSQVKAAIGQLSMSIYTQLAVALLSTRDPILMPRDADSLRQLAKDSQAAALAYFEGLGIISQNQGESQ